MGRRLEESMRVRGEGVERERERENERENERESERGRKERKQEEGGER